MVFPFSASKLDFEFIDDVDIEADATEMDEPSL